MHIKSHQSNLINEMHLKTAVEQSAVQLVTWNQTKRSLKNKTTEAADRRLHSTRPPPSFDSEPPTARSKWTADSSDFDVWIQEVRDQLGLVY